MKPLAVLFIAVLPFAAGQSTSVKDSVKAALGQKAVSTWGAFGHALPDPSAEARVQFWVRPGLEAPTVQERLQHAWAAVLSPTGENNTGHCT